MNMKFSTLLHFDWQGRCVLNERAEVLTPMLAPMGEHGWPPALAGQRLDALAALDALARHDTPMQRPPVGIIGPREANEAQCRLAATLGERLAQLAVPVLCGGRGGVMEAAGRGAAEAGGTVIGLLPDNHWESANPWITLPLASGLGEARNVVIARASTVLIAVGNSPGTLTEVAFGCHFGRCVLGLDSAPQMAGCTPLENAEQAVALTAAALWGCLPTHGGETSEG